MEDDQTGDVVVVDSFAVNDGAEQDPFLQAEPGLDADGQRGSGDDPNAAGRDIGDGDAESDRRLPAVE